MTTAWQAYQEPVDQLNRDYPDDDHSWDRDIDRLHAQDEHAHPSRRPPGTTAAQSPIAHARYLAYLARTGRPYPTHADTKGEHDHDSHL